jgi:hypothetical protein
MRRGCNRQDSVELFLLGLQPGRQKNVRILPLAAARVGRALFKAHALHNAINILAQSDQVPWCQPGDRNGAAAALPEHIII